MMKFVLPLLCLAMDKGAISIEVRREGHFRQTTTLIRYQTRPLPVLETKFEDFESRVLPTPKPQSHALPSLDRNHSHFSSLGAHLSPAKERPVPDPIVTLAHLSSAAENRRAEERPVPDPPVAPKHFPLAEERPVSDPLVTLISHEDAVNAAQAAGRQSVATSDPAVADLPVKMLVRTDVTQNVVSTYEDGMPIIMQDRVDPTAALAVTAGIAFVLICLGCCCTRYQRLRSHYSGEKNRSVGPDGAWEYTYSLDPAVYAQWGAVPVGKWAPGL